MMIFKHLFDNRDLADMIFGYREHDGEQVGIMDRYRISANAVYPFYLSEIGRAACVLLIFNLLLFSLVRRFTAVRRNFTKGVVANVVSLGRG